MCTGGLPHISPHARASLFFRGPHLRPRRLRERLRQLRAGLRAWAPGTARGGPLEQRRMHHRPVGGAEGPGPDGEEGVPMGAPSVKGTSFRLPFPTPRLVMPTVRNTSPLLNLAIIGERELVRTSARAGAQPARRRGEFRRRREGPQERGFSPAGGRRTSRYGDAPVHRSDRAGEPF